VLTFGRMAIEVLISSNRELRRVPILSRNDPAGRVTNGLSEPPEWCLLPENAGSVGFVRVFDAGRDKPRDNLDE
jgi:hypothetical protein